LKRDLNEEKRSHESMRQILGDGGGQRVSTKALPLSEIAWQI
jgi:hypothetical protein